MAKRRLKLKQKSFLIIAVLSIVVMIIAFQGYKFIKRTIELKNLSLTLDYEKLDLYEHDSGKLAFHISNDNFLQDLRCSSDNDKVIVIDNNGEFKAIAVGTAQLSLQVKDSDKKVKCTVEVHQEKKLNSIEITGIPKYDIYSQTEFKLNVLFKPKDTTQTQLEISSSHPEVATVDETGLVQTKSIGQTILTVKVKNTDIHKEIKLNVVEKPIPSKIVDFKADSELKEETGSIFQFREILNMSDNSASHYQFSSNDNNVASISPDGIVTTKRPGYVTVSYKDEVSKKEKKLKLIVKCDSGFINQTLLQNSGINDCQKLMIVAHPDDETLWGGGHLLEGNWFVVVLTNGYNAQRVKELADAMTISQTKYIILNYPDLKKKNVKDDWSMVLKGIKQDVNKLLKYKNWKEIVTHSPKGEYGHIHHKMTNQMVKEATIKNGMYNKLYYFGKFYSNDGKFYNNPKIPKRLKPTYQGDILNKKMQMVEAFTSQIGAIHKFWEQMIPYEEWTKAC